MNAGLRINPEDVQRYKRYLDSGGETQFTDWQNSGSPATSWFELYAKRNHATQQEQAPLANLEHAAWAREYVHDNPILGVPAMMALVPGYTALKALGAMNGRTPPSLKEMGAGYQGMWEGLADNLTR
jgi:hypothetical protein